LPFFCLNYFGFKIKLNNMAWFNWFSNKRAPITGSSSGRGDHADVLSSQQLDFTRPMMGQRPASASGQPAAVASAQRLEQRRTERNAKRELLFQVVRESMVRVGVLSSSFKFKVLSLDQRGRSFLVMIELSAEFSGEVEKLAQIESMIAQTARHRFEVIVQAVYWRYFNTAQAPANAAGAGSSTPSASNAASSPAPLLGALQARISRPAPLFAMDGAVAPAALNSVAANASSAAQVAAMRAASAATQKTAAITGSFPIIGATAAQRAAATAPRPPQDDLSDDEVAAFRKALAAGAAQGAMAASVGAATPVAALKPLAAPAAPSTLEQARSKLLLTGYEDTEMADDDPMPALSGTQYGDLR
jgi:hypothetical protein